jgi:hypothetical protein
VCVYHIHMYMLENVLHSVIARSICICKCHRFIAYESLIVPMTHHKQPTHLVSDLERAIVDL